MGFSENAKKYFFDELGLNNREISKRMDNYSEVLVSRYMNSDNLSATFIKKIQKYFPEADINRLISEEEALHILREPSELYEKEALIIVKNMIEELQELKELLTRE